MKQVEMIIHQDMNKFRDEMNSTLRLLYDEKNIIEDIQYKFINDKNDNRSVYTALIVYDCLR
jgi:hypothetical protein